MVKIVQRYININNGSQRNKTNFIILSLGLFHYIFHHVFHDRRYYCIKWPIHPDEMNQTDSSLPGLNEVRKYQEVTSFIKECS